jgi:hypothetical protein
VKWVGVGAFKFGEQIREAAGAAGIGFVSDKAGEEADAGAWVLSGNVEALAETVAVLGRERFGGGGSWDAAALGAVYVRPSDAELKG